MNKARKGTQESRTTKWLVKNQKTNNPDRAVHVKIYEVITETQEFEAFKNIVRQHPSMCNGVTYFTLNNHLDFKREKEIK